MRTPARLAPMLTLVLTVGLAAPARAQDPALELEEVQAAARTLLWRLRAEPRSLIEQKFNVWQTSDYKDRREVEGWIDALNPLTNEQLQALFAPLDKAGPQATQKAREILGAVARGEGVPAPPEGRRLVIVLVGGGAKEPIQHLGRALVGETTHWPRLATEIRPYATLLTSFQSSTSAEANLAVLLGGTPDPKINPGEPPEPLTPTFLEMYRKATGAPAKACWILYRGAKILCDQSFANKAAKLEAISVWGEKLRSIVDRARADEILSIWRKEKTSPLDFGATVEGISASVLHFDTFYADKEVQDILTWVANRTTSVSTDSDLFLSRTAEVALRMPTPPSILILRMGPPEAPAGTAITPEMVADYCRDRDTLLYQVWLATRESAPCRGRTFFWLVPEGSGVALVSGPGIRAGGQESAGGGLQSVVATAARMLNLPDLSKGLDFVSKKPIEKLFAESPPPTPKPPKGGDDVKD
ncbi:MAG: hypothetical protein L0216_17045 [Planctomycetales bacterium]|nr:hypothetical protein [Planctomycetales bacterium]